MRAHIAVLRDLAKRDPATTMVMLAMIGAMEEMVEELERLAEAVSELRGDTPPDDSGHFGTI